MKQVYSAPLEPRPSHRASPLAAREAAVLILAILVLSLALQLLAAGLAIRLIGVTGRRWAWLFIAAALVFMASRRAVTLDGLLRHRLDDADLSAELVALAISVLMVAGVSLIGPVFEALRQSEERLRRSDAELREVIAAAPDGMLLVRDGRCVYGSRALGHTLRRGGAGSLRGESVIELAHPDERGAFAAWLGTAGAAPLEVRFQTADGAPVTVEVVHGPTLDFEGAPATLLVLRDHSERKELHEQLAQAQKMEAVGQLAGGIAHDFNNILSVILGYSGLLASQTSPVDSRCAEILEIEAAGMRAAELTQQLLAFSRKQILQPKIVNLNDTLTGIERILRRLIGEDIELIVLAEPLLGRTRVDPSQLEQIVMNLAVNARDAMPQGGKLTLETANVELAPHAGPSGGAQVMLAVTDSGTGMDQATQARMFEPFFTTKEEGKGTGLGLATVFGIVQQSGGSISVHSEVGKGTSIKVYLPRTDAVAVDAIAPRSDVVGGTETILVVEDDERVRAVTLTILRRLGYHVLEAQGGGDALLLSELHPGEIQLLLADVIMPRMGGPQLAERLRALRPTMKVLFVSGYTDSAIVHQGVLDQGVALLQKPITPAGLALKVREVLDRPGK